MRRFSLPTLTGEAVQVERFWESGGVHPGDAVADLEPGVLDSAGEAVPGAGASEGEQVAPGLEDAQAFGGPLLAPLLEGAHVGGICRRRV